jgi:hypothetical protein
VDIQQLLQELIHTLSGYPVTLSLSQPNHVTLKTTTILNDIIITPNDVLQFTLDNGCVLVCAPSQLEKNKYGDWITSQGDVTVVIHRL